MEYVHLKPINPPAHLENRRHLKSVTSLSCETGLFCYPILPDPIGVTAASTATADKRKQVAAA